MKSGDIGLIVVGFIVIAILVGGGLYLYQRSRFNEHSEDVKTMNVELTNETPYTHTITTKEGMYVVRPGETGKIQVERHDDISATSRRPDGEPVEFIHRLSNDLIDHLYITLDGFRTNITSSPGGELVNASETDILFIQKSLKGGEKIVVQNVPLMSVVPDVHLSRRSLWLVAYPSDPDVPVAELKLGSGSTTRIVFDGLRLRAY